ncbi:DMT family transporter [Tolypothrix sp. FACHB-123]|uniref:DMT family transporter n=1 Tax=Tolypothrix sp. FACHB-123 TaxID=2692868 RepID=UPI00168A15CC|nr:DMT family transporter [Tolypothrix sp. FACHB-123]MBD2353137.1 DMT family transporter [Tolypothrix sp. FACHB-123]
MISIYLNRLRAIASRCQTSVYLLLALLSGAILPIQASLNAQLARSLDSIPLAADISYLVGALVLIALLSTRQFGHPDWTALPKAPRWSLLGGVLGAWYIASSTYFVSVLGTALTLGFVVCGQAIAGIVTDNFGWLGVPQRRLTQNRRFAVGLLIVSIFFLSQGR